MILSDTHALRLPIEPTNVIGAQIFLTGDTDHFSATMRQSLISFNDLIMIAGIRSSLLLGLSDACEALKVVHVNRRRRTLQRLHHA
jgi:hypothetical protein